MATDPSVVAIVLSWNNYEDTAECLTELLALEYPRLEVIVVDNGSTDGSIDTLSQEFPTIDIIRNQTNLGFAGGMNVGIREALDRGADYVWLLNNDILFPNTRLLEDLVTVMEESTTIGILSPEIREYPNTNNAWYVTGEIDWSSGSTHHDLTTDDGGGTVLQTSYIPFCCALVRASVFNEIGVLPEQYFLYYEDVDFAVRAREAGFELMTTTGNRIFHKESVSAGGRMNPTFSYYRTRNMLLFQKQFPDRLDSGSGLATITELGKAIAVRGVRGNLRGIKAVIHGAVHGIAGVTGRGPYP